MMYPLGSSVKNKMIKIPLCFVYPMGTLWLWSITRNRLPTTAGHQAGSINAITQGNEDGKDFRH